MMFLVAAAVISICLLGVCWAFGGFDKPEVIWEWEQGRETHIARWMDESGMKGTDELLEMDPDQVRIGSLE